MTLDFTAKAPKIAKKAKHIIQHGITRIDQYDWLRADNWQDVMQSPDRLSSNIRDMLVTENDYYETVTAPLLDLKEQIFEEMKGRIEPTETGVPTPDGQYAYYHTYRAGDQHGLYKRGQLIDREKLTFSDDITLLDIDALAKNYTGFFNLGSCEHSPNHAHLAYSIDHQGAENYQIFIQSIDGSLIKTNIEKSSGDIQWAADSRTIFWIERDDNQRPCFVYAQDVFNPDAKPKLIYKEDNPGFFVSVGESDSGRFIEINVHNHTTSEIWMIPSASPFTSPICFAPRQHGCEYHVSDGEDQFYILTNYGDAVDFQIMQCANTDIGPLTHRKYWSEYAEHKPGRLILSQTVYDNYHVRLERENALPRIVITDIKNNESHNIEFDEAAYSLGLLPGLEYKTNTIRFTYSSPTTPTQTIDYKLTDRTRILRKTRQVPTGHSSEDYITDRKFITARDGEDIPVTLLYHKDTQLDGSAPCLLYGYGSYGITIPAAFRTSILSLADRGFVYAIAHIRGSQAKGYQWYLDGKLDNKPNTFNDFIDVGRSLASTNYTSIGKIVAHGGSAGGLLVGAALNLDTELFAGIIGDVPFVDVLTTISDDTLPLTPPEWPEWGNPITDKEAYDIIASYSPYDQVTAKSYPPVLITAGLTDPRVTYWEPAKWAAKLRECQTGTSPILLKTNMTAGHAGESGRYDSLKELSEVYAFAVSIV
ncbi:MAG: S9 family peptidase [Maricaulaceae bacterium]